MSEKPAGRDLTAELDHAEFTGWMEAQGHPSGDGYAEYGHPDMAEAFAAGMQAARDLAAAAPAQKVIIVTAPANGSERRYDADGYAITDGTLFVNRRGVTAACHPAGTWTSFRFGDAIADDSQRKALAIAMRALSGIVRRADDGGATPFGRPEIGDIASAALNDIWTETEG